ncbi:MAG: PAS domain S-box protein [Candidatus Omnitrophica bacterium]|nr:PAS domain S-box protein [Candidatus Omnitrophota bacterium]
MELFQKKQQAALQIPYLTIALTIVILIAGALLTWWKVAQTEQQMRSQLIQQAQLVAQGVNIDHLRELTGTDADLNSPVYLRLKEQLGAIRSSDPNYRFAYFLGRKSNGDIFFFVDNELPDSKDCSPAGQVYTEASENMRRVFSTRTEGIEGPYADRWGTWISALIPIQDPLTVKYGLATTQDAQAIVGKAADFYRQNGREAFLKEVNDPQGQFHKDDLYVFVYDQSMTMLARPVKPELVGKNLLEKKDWAGGKYFRKEIQRIALSKGRGWVDYEYENPVDKQIEPKTTYVQKLDDMIVCAGAYKGTGNILAVLGIDINAGRWQSMLVFAAVPFVVFTLGLILILWVGMLLLAARSRSSAPSRWMWHLETFLTLVIGLYLTVFFTWVNHEAEVNNRKEAFNQIAVSQTAGVAETLRNIRATALEGLASFYESRADVTADDFTRYTGHLINQSSVKAWGWVPCVSAAERTQFEMAARANGLTDFGIWQKDAQGNKVPAAERGEYYPLYQLTPMKGNERALGYDLASESIRRAALEEAKTSGLMTATDPVALVQGKGGETGMHIYRPVFAKDDPKRLRGLVLATLETQALLNSAVVSDLVFMQVTLLRRNAPPRLLAISWDVSNAPRLGISAMRPVFAFGKVFAVTAYAGPGFERIHPLRSGLWTFIVGALFTGVFVFVMGIILYRREELERLISERTQQLFQSENRFYDVFYASQDATLLIGENKFIDANDATARMLEYPTRQEFLKVHPSQLSPPTQPDGRSSFEKAEEMMRLAVEKGFHQFEWIHRRANGKDFPVQVSLTPITLQGKRVIYCVWLDLTAKKRAEQALHQSEENIRTITDVAKDAIIMIDTKGLITFWNPSAQRIFGYSSQEVIGKNLHQLIVPERLHSAHAEAFPNFLRTGEGAAVGKTLELPAIRKDGVEIPIELSLNAVHREDGWHAVGVMRDISERLKTEREIKEKVEELKRFNDLMLEREGRVLEIKKEVNQLLTQLGKPKKYNVVEEA